jgi:hypothetical protein
MNSCIAVPRINPKHFFRIGLSYLEIYVLAYKTNAVRLFNKGEAIKNRNFRIIV